MAKYTFEQIKIAQNEDLNNPVINRALRRLFENSSSSEKGNLPDSSSVTSASVVFINSTNIDESTWLPVSSLASLLPPPNIYQASDAPGYMPTSNGVGLVWNTAANSSGGQWQYKKLKQKLSELDDVSIVNPKQYESLTYFQNKWTNTTQETYLGVGYIKHIVCTQPTIIELPSDIAELNGNEQIEITKVIPGQKSSNSPDGDSTQNNKYPILIITKQNTKSFIINPSWTSIINNNDEEPFSSIHLRAMRETDENGNYTGNYIWIPVSMTGTWKPSTKTTLVGGSSSADYSANQTVNTLADLTSNELRIQPYNLNVKLDLNNTSIYKVFEIPMKFDSDQKLWKANGNITQGATISDIVNGQYISLVHGLINNIPVKVTVYYQIPGESKLRLASDTGYEVWYNNASDFSTIYIDPFVDDEYGNHLCVGQSGNIKLVILTSI
jgi:hypothetical protein